MPTDLKALFDAINVHWVDRGPNVTPRPDHIAIKCPFCADDPSEHLGISPYDGFYCRRNPHQHSGRSFVRLLRALLPNQSREQIAALLNQFATQDLQPREAPKRPSLDIERAWAKFEPAANHTRYLQYLASRGFPDPAATARRFDLRYARNGEWAARLLIPIFESGRLVTWAGRAIRDGLEPRYKNQPTDDEGLVYMPRPMRANALVVEGSIDALKIAVATEYMPISPIALLGTSTNDARVMRIAEHIRACQTCYVCLDSPIPYPDTARSASYGPITPTAYRMLIFGLARLAKTVRIIRLPVPHGRGDFGATPVDEIAAYLSNISTPRGNGYVPMQTYKQASREHR